LLPHEVAPGGACCELHPWLDDNISRFGLVRPNGIRKSMGSMTNEPWHLSFASQSMPLVERVFGELLLSSIEAEGVLGIEHIVPILDKILMLHHRGVCLAA
jgi:hypothetical protein